MLAGRSGRRADHRLAAQPRGRRLAAPGGDGGRQRRQLHDDAGGSARRPCSSRSGPATADARASARACCASTCAEGRVRARRLERAGARAAAISRPSRRVEAAHGPRPPGAAIWKPGGRLRQPRRCAGRRAARRRSPSPRRRAAPPARRRSPERARARATNAARPAQASTAAVRVSLRRVHSRTHHSAAGEQHDAAQRSRAAARPRPRSRRSATLRRRARSESGAGEAQR